MTEAEFECSECGAPSPPTSMSGCRNCGGQGAIWPKGTRQKLRERPGDVVIERKNDVMLASIDGVLISRWRASEGAPDPG